MATYNINIVEENSDKDVEQNKKKNLTKINLNDLNIQKDNIIQENSNLENDLDNRTITEYDSEIENKNKILKNYNRESKKQYNGRWTIVENKIFLEGFFKYRNNWKKLNEVIRSRTIVQLRSHAQKFLIKVKKYIKNSQNENFVKGKIEDLFKKELNEKYDPSYLHNFTQYILKLYSQNNNKSNRFLKKNFENVEHSTFSSIKLPSKYKLKNALQASLKNKNNLSCTQNSTLNNLDKSIITNNKNLKNNPSLYINMLTVNYINSGNKKIENHIPQMNQKKDQILNYESPNKTENCSSDGSFTQNEQNAFGESIFPIYNINESDDLEKFDETQFFGENWLKKC